MSNQYHLMRHVDRELTVSMSDAEVVGTDHIDLEKPNRS